MCSTCGCENGKLVPVTTENGREYMCTTCGCNPEEDHHDHDNDRHHDHGHGRFTEQNRVFRMVPGGKRISVETDILAGNNLLAMANRETFAEKGIFVLNMVSSPGSGKTTILEKTLREISPHTRCATIEGDQQTDNDALRIAATGVPVRQINTGAACHLDARMVGNAAAEFDLDHLDILFIENVGNLVCPASFDLGENHKVVVLSVTEGDDKPLKYPQMFHEADVMLINKIDLLPFVDFDLAKCKKMALWVNPGITFFELSAKTGEGMDEWYAWLAAGVRKHAAYGYAPPLPGAGHS
jgi:hydrogenase nickel incorporation protein HypB